jgi:7,8-dihydropterin-6-yl-methyl-4-(beta-D-ribofuranosyl)aminobenzene 5'-phosphate synthase
VPHDPALVDAWGFACLVEAGGGTVLFDTGGEGPILMGNMAALGINLAAIDAVVLSHIHGDHVGGLDSFLAAAGHDPPVYVPAAFPASFKEQVSARTDLVEVTGSMEILPGIHSTGELGRSIVEQGLIVETGEGMVVVTGCAHPGVVEMVRRAREVLDGEIALVMGGFHLGQASYSRIEDIIGDFRALGVRMVAPSHCTGELALRQFREAYGADFVRGYLGDVITIAAPGR